MTRGHAARQMRRTAERKQWSAGIAWKSRSTKKRETFPHQRIKKMNDDKIKGQWKQIAGKVKEKWGKLTDDDMKVAEGNAEYLAGKIQERYGIAKDEAKKQVDEFNRSID